MASQACGKCDKTVYQTEKVEAAGKWFHKGCFKCNDPACNIQLNLKSFQAVNGSVWCDKHVPKPTATAVADSVSVLHALNAPKKASENLKKAQVGTGETPNIGLDTISNQHALNAPRKVAENLHKTQVGTGDNSSYGLDTMQTQHALNAPRKNAENLGFVQKGGSQSAMLVPRSSQENLGPEEQAPNEYEHEHEPEQIEA
ncbi:hypothetical protein BC832DRAFT_566644 [Gaertneriomyces semiglobifer]|nr:hypothetical protein BC832DRAFT_566644 [Gaertneriomyces semiglobifer]